MKLRIRTIIPVRGRKQEEKIMKNMKKAIDKNHNPRKGTETATRPLMTMK